ncbi:prephenate dehydrogenase/arogenate dehydrogenase family protein [Xylophilus rhododendri]|uniref:Prephenate dehydrogenase/arogenate dehydrogenase family protein n=1 Tax=Xylophilus rhododendri TaxID=2697032 RepID=A0A857J6Q0_9BURK|nr:NAD(P)-dependent oxidoreductase [Xylophilus rhododendri]QHI99674.1 prephenate dehydrogenase/arogenate dehydrogenase family protein [Xylophilus rhododendri]
MSEFKKIGVVGLGNMGRGMALSLARAGFEVLGYDASAQASDAAAAEGIAVDRSLAALAACDAVVLSLPTTAIVSAVLEGASGLLATARAGLLVVDTTSGDPQATRELAARLAKGGVRFIDAPVSGGAAGARKGTLTMFIGGSQADVGAAEAVLAAMGDKRFHIGDVGAGDIAKIVNNLLVASHLLTASEAFRMAEAAGVRTEQLIEAVNAGSGRSGVTLYNYPSRILNQGFDSGFTVALMRKDVNLAMALQQSLGLNFPVTEEVGDIWNASAAVLKDQDDFNRIVTFDKTARATQE